MTGHSGGPRRGFSLIEMMLVVSVMGILVLAGIPAFRRAQRDTALASGRNALVAAIARARTVAISRGRRRRCGSPATTSGSRCW